MKKLLVVAMGIAVALVGLAACQNNANAQIIVQYATMKVIEKGDTPAAQHERADKIRNIAGEASAVLRGDDAVTLDLLEAAVRTQLDKLNLAPSDAFLANALVSEVMAELQARVGTAVLDSEQRVKVADVLDWVVQAANLSGA